MKKLLIFFLALLIATLSGCSKAEEATDDSAPQKHPVYNVEKPLIKSSDPIMPLYVDISIYDEEDYSKVYLGKDFQFDFNYSGTAFSLPTDYPTVKEAGYDFSNLDEYNSESIVKAGQTLEVLLQDAHSNLLCATFYNQSYASLKIESCPIVKLSIKENNLTTEGSLYSQFSINGVNNHSVITDVIDALGAPSHFETFIPNHYRLSYFLTAADRREKIVIGVDMANDCICSVEVAKYK